MGIHRLFAVLLAAATVCGCAARSGAVRIPPPVPPERWPTAGWQEAAPESQGVDSAALADLLDHVAARDTGLHSLLLIRHGRLVFEASFFPCNGATPHDIASVTKSVTSTLLGAAIHQGLLDRLDRPVAALLGRPAPDAAHAAITLEHLATMRSGLACGLVPGEVELLAMTRSPDYVGYVLGLPLADAPGRRFAYCSPNTHLLSAAITQVTGQSEEDFAARALFGPLGIVPGEWPRDPAGLSHGWGDLRLLPRDLAKLGLLMLHDGVWDGRRLLPEGWVASATRSRGPARGDEGYGLGWWTPGAALPGAYMAHGRGGQIIFVWPAADLVAVTTGAGFDAGPLVPFLRRAIRGAGPLSANDAAARRLAAGLAAARSGPAPAPVALPDLAARLSGRVYRMDPNPVGIERLGFEFGADGAAVILGLSSALAAGAAGRYRLAMGLDGRPALTPDGPRGYAVALRGTWRPPDALDLDYVEPAGSNAFSLHAGFEGDKVRVTVRDRTGMHGDVTMGGQAE